MWLIMALGRAETFLEFSNIGLVTVMLLLLLTLFYFEKQASKWLNRKANQIRI